MAPTKPFIPKQSVAQKGAEQLPATPAMGAWMEFVTGQANSGSGAVMTVTATAPIASSGGANPNISHNVSGVVAGVYGDDTTIPQVTVDTFGHVTDAVNVPITFPTPDIQALLDGISTTQGALLYRNASDWVALNPGTNGQFLETLGAAMNPQWADVSTVDYVVLGNGVQPPTPVDDGAGSFIYVGYLP